MLLRGQSITDGLNNTFENKFQNVCLLPPMEKQ